MSQQTGIGVGIDARRAHFDAHINAVQQLSLLP